VRSSRLGCAPRRRATWQRVLSLIAEDAVFLLPGQPPMRGREAFAAALRPALGQVHIEGRSEIKEIHVAENYAFCWSQLSLTVTSVSGRACPTARWSDVSLSQRARWTLGSLSRCEHAHGGINVKLSKTGTDSRKVIRIVARQRMAGDERSSSRMASSSTNGRTLTCIRRA
jgi:ketosteroid isomerase-like protein